LLALGISTGRHRLNLGQQSKEKENMFILLLARLPGNQFENP